MTRLVGLTQDADSTSGTKVTLMTHDRVTNETTLQGTVATLRCGRRRSSVTYGASNDQLSYDAANRLTQITQGSATVTISYDALWPPYISYATECGCCAI